MNQFFRVVAQTEPATIQKQDGSNILKSTIVLQEIGGRFESSYACSLLGNAASGQFYPGDLVLASLRFSTHEHQGVYYQDITVQEIVPLGRR